MREVKAGDIIRVKLGANEAEAINDFKRRASVTIFRTDILSVEHPNGGYVPVRGAPMRFVRPEHTDACLLDKIKAKIAELGSAETIFAANAIPMLEDLLEPEKPTKAPPKPKDARPRLEKVTYTAYKRDAGRRQASHWLEQRGFVRRIATRKFAKGNIVVELGDQAVKILERLSQPEHKRVGWATYTKTHKRIGGATYAAIERSYPDIEAFLMFNVPGERL